MVTSCPRHFCAEPSSRVLATFFSQLKKTKRRLVASSLFLEREKGLLPIRHRYAADCQPYGLDARGTRIKLKKCLLHGHFVPTALLCRTLFEGSTLLFLSIMKREKGLLTISLRCAADCQPYGLDACGLASSSKSAYFMVTSCPRHFCDVFDVRLVGSA